MYGKEHLQETKDKISNSNKGKIKSPEAIEKQASAIRGRPGPNLGKKLTEETRKKMSEAHRERVKTHSGGSGWSGWYNNFYFRSISELRYLIEEIENKGYTWETAETKEFCVEYIHPDGTKRLYHPDFCINKYLIIEVKPRSFLKNPVVQAKILAATEFFRNKNMDYKIVDAIPLNLIDLKNLINCGKVVLIEKWHNCFLKKIKSKGL